MQTAHLVKISVLMAMALSHSIHADSRIPSDIPRDEIWTANAPVHAISCTPDTVFLGGEFDYVGPNTGALTQLDMESGQISKKLPYIEGKILVCVPDGSGGWYVGGELYNIEGVAHILSDGTLDHSWNPRMRGVVQAIAVGNSTIYVGGMLHALEDYTQNFLLEIDIDTGEITDWHPALDGPVYALTISDSTLYVGGEFSTFLGQPRSRLAAIDLANNSLTEWAPAIDNESYNYISAIQVVGSNVYIGGRFRQIAGEYHSQLSVVDKETGLPGDWDPDSYGEVWSLWVVGDYMYAAGDFMYIDGKDRNFVAQFDLTTGRVTDWNPNPDGFIGSLAFTENATYAAGTFKSIGGEGRKYLAALDPVTGAAQDWNPNPEGPAYTLQISGSDIIVGGEFTSICGETRNGLAELHAPSGQLSSWNPPIGGWIYKLAASNNSVYATGNIWYANNRKITSFDRISGDIRDWDTLCNGSVYALALSGNSSLFVGGRFTNIGGKARAKIAEIDLPTATATDWNPGANNDVDSIVLSGQTVYALGDFTNIGGEARSGIAALDMSSGSATEWNPIPYGGTVDCLARAGSIVFVGGSFTSIGGKQRKYLAALDATTGQATDWNPNPDGPVQSLSASESTVYVSGSFHHIAGENRSGIAAFDAQTGQLLAWNPDYTPGRFTISEHSVFIKARKNGNQFAQFDFPTASIPVAPMVNGLLEKSVDVAINTNDENGPDTEYALYCTTESRWVQLDGTLGPSRAWATADEWGTKTVTGLNDATAYEFQARARNSDNIQTIAGPSATGITPCIITYTAYENGIIDGASRQVIQYGGNASVVTAVPNTGYHFVQWSDGLATSSRSDTNLTANNTLTAIFAINQYTLTYQIGVNGSIMGEKIQTVHHGADGTAVTALPKNGFSFIGWTDGVQTAERTETQVTKNLNVRALLERDRGSLTVTIKPEAARTAEAKWRRVGTTSWLESGATESGLVTGKHRIEFCPVRGWAKPTNRTVTITKDGLTKLNVSYALTAVNNWDEYR